MIAIADLLRKVLMSYNPLKHRSDFLNVRGGVRWVTPSFILQARTSVEDVTDRQGEEDVNASRVGFTVTKKIGNAVKRNRVRRRLKEVVRQNADLLSKAAVDYVLIARQGAENRQFGVLNEDFRLALRRVHGKLRANSDDG